MSFSTRLCNATPFPVKWKWHRGYVLKIEPFGYTDVSSQIMEQMMPDQPGYEGIKTEMDHFGVFLRDNSRTYEAQALEAVKSSIKSKSQIYNDCAGNLRDRAAQAGNVTQESIEHKLEAGGYTRLAKEIEELKKISEMLDQKTQKERKRHEQYDPERTLLFTNPPRVFESPVAMEQFLMYNPDMKKQQDAFMRELKKGEKGATAGA